MRGFRVEPGEVEAALAEHPQVGQAAVLVQATARGEPRLVAYFATRAPASGSAPDGAADCAANSVAVPASAPDIAELRAFLKRRLPEYLVPAAFVRLPALPLTVSGKIDRDRLAAFDGADEAAADGEYLAPGTPEEIGLAAIWAQLLELGRVGRNDHFFDLGGHSLLAMQMVSRVREAFGTEMPLRAVFEWPTLEGYAGAIARERGATTPDAIRARTSPEEALLARIEELSEAEIDSLLDDMLLEGDEK
ncbi:phosphopantetheine-binding protein [Lysobacter enzymogenes]|uniref:phosphopantetheine-binding protein n=1 Tax=Lysobacter enzymogenes TaxID=69 RepID=UPI003D2F6564